MVEKNHVRKKNNRTIYHLYKLNSLFDFRGTDRPTKKSMNLKTESFDSIELQFDEVYMDVIYHIIEKIRIQRFHRN